ncbi:MAG: hypothetical protein HY851_00535, partial [candidate division Zixibacteria bacterium]|nr:hypothetical protein [candidate division Zixibacteria bacterium]
LFRGRIWLILVVYYAFQWLILYGHEQFTSPMFSWMVSLAMVFKDANRAEAFTHYPAHYVFLPDVYGGVKFVVSLVFEGLALGAVAGVFLQRFGGRKESAGGKSALKMWLNLAIAWIVLNGLTVVLSYSIPALLKSQLFSPKRVALFNFVIMPAVFSLCMALFYYSLPIVMATGRNGFRALVMSLKLFLKYPIMTFVIAAITVSGPVLMAAISSAYATTVVDKFRPELVYWLLVAGLFVEMAASFVWMGAASRLVIDELE